MIESTHNELRFTAPLTAITAAVVGVIVNLAVFFGYHVWWPNGFHGQTDWIAAAITVVALLSLIRFRQNVIRVIAACAVAGLLAKIYLPGM